MEIQKFTVSNDPEIYEAWPDLIRTQGGKLICVFSECKHHVNRDDARIVWVESTDRGRTWSEKKFLTAKGKKNLYYNCARISVLGDGRLAIVCDWITGNENAQSEIHMWFADPEGERWEGPLILPFCGIVPDKLKQLRSGRWILPAHFLNPETGKLEQYLWYSDDFGRTWSDKVTVAADDRYNLCEVSVYECADDTLVAFMRENSGLGYDCLKTVSRDHGCTWSELYACPIPGCHRPVVDQLQSGTLMMTYRFLQGGPGFAQNLFAAFFAESDAVESARNQQKVRIVPLDFDRNPVPDLGYTGWVQFDDGEIYVVNYIKDNSDKGQIRGYAFREEMFIFGKEK